MDERLYGQAVDVVLETGRPSISIVQRRLCIGYVVAASLLAEMERRGVLGPLGTNGIREIIGPRDKDSEGPSQFTSQEKP